MEYEGNGVVYCEGGFATTYGKTAHGLVRFTERYNIVAVIDSTMEGEPDGGEFLDGKSRGIPVVRDLARAFQIAGGKGLKLTHFIIGLATDGGYLTDEIRAAVREALINGLNADSGLHDFLNDDRELSALAAEKGLVLRDIRRPASGSNHMFSGRISQVTSKRIALLGTDSALGKRTTAWLLVHGLRENGLTSELIGTGQTAWLQGARYSMVLDSLVNDYVSGELEEATWRAWSEQRPDFLVIEGQGSLMNPAYPGGFEILAACRPDGIIMQHAPARAEYDGFPGYPVDSLADQIFLVEFLSKKKVIGVTINHEGLDRKEIGPVCRRLEDEHQIPVCDPLVEGIDKMVKAVRTL